MIKKLFLLYIFFIFHWNHLKAFVDAYHKWTMGRSCDLFISIHMILPPFSERRRVWGLHSQWSWTKLGTGWRNRSTVREIGGCENHIFFALCYESIRWLDYCATPAPFLLSISIFMRIYKHLKLLLFCVGIKYAHFIAFYNPNNYKIKKQPQDLQTTNLTEVEHVGNS